MSAQKLTHPAPRAEIIPAYLLPLLDLFAAHGEAAYPVGGCVRDSLRGVEPHDWDVAVTTPPERTRALCEAAGYRVIPTGLAHGTVTVLAPLCGEATDRAGDYAPVECTTCRTEGGYTDSRHPDSVAFTGRIEDDLARRDFTVNAMAFVISPCFPPCDHRGATVDSPCKISAASSENAKNTTKWELTVLDLFGGRADLSAGVIRCVGDPNTRFEEDALRILRAVRFATRLGFALDSATRDAMVRRRAGLSRISRERIAAELEGILCSPAPERGVRLLMELGLMPYVLPRGLSPVWASAMAVSEVEADEPKTIDTADDLPVLGTPRLSDLPAEPTPRLAALLWGLSPEVLEADLASQRLPNAVRRAVEKIVESRNKSVATTDFAVRQWRHELGESAVTALLVRRAHLPEDTPEIAELDRMIALVRASEAAGEPVNVADLALSGRDLLAIGMKPGPGVQAMLWELLVLVWEDPAANERERLLEEARGRME